MIVLFYLQKEKKFKDLKKKIGFTCIRTSMTVICQVILFYEYSLKIICLLVLHLHIIIIIVRIIVGSGKAFLPGIHLPNLREMWQMQVIVLLMDIITATRTANLNCDPQSGDISARPYNTPTVNKNKYSPQHFMSSFMKCIDKKTLHSRQQLV